MPTISPLAAIRWLPLVNQTDTTIPAFACVQVVGTALDATGQLLVSVAQPTGDPSATYLFNGPCAIAAGAGGSGTLDFPAQAAWDTSTPAVGDTWGPKSAQWSLSKGAVPGFPVLGIVDAPTQRMMVAAPTTKSATIVKPAYDIAAITGSTPGSGTGEVYTFDGTTLSDSESSITVFNLSTQVAKAATFYECIYIGSYALIVNGGSVVTLFEAVLYTNLATSDAMGAITGPGTAIWGSLPDLTSPLAAQNDVRLSGTTGQTFLVAQADGGTYYLLATMSSGAGGITFTLSEALLSGSASATVGTAWGSAPDDEGDAVTVNDLEGLWVRALSGARGEALYDPAEGYIVVACDQETLKYRGVLGGTLTHSTGSVGIGSLMAMNSFPFGQATSEETITAENVMQLGGPNGAACYLDWNQAAGDGAGQWELTMVSPVPQQVMCRERLDSSNNLQCTTRMILGWFDDNAESSFTTVPGWTTTNITAVIGEQFSGGALQYQTQTFTAIGTAGTPGAWTNVFTTVNVIGVTDLQYAGYPTHAFQDKTANFTAIDPSYFGAAHVTKSAWSNWASTVLADPLTAVALTGAGALSQQTTDMYVMEMAFAPNLGTPAGSLTTTTATIVAAVAYAGGALSYQMQTLTILGAGAVGASTNLFTTGTVSAYTTLAGGTGSTPTLAGKQTSFTAINPGAEGSAANWYTPSSQTVVTTVTWDGTNLKQQTVTAFVFNYTSSVTTTTIDTPDVCSTS